ncbi:MAG TPA: GNAT family N-acetyltransferase [Actinomycetota bacterium]
MTLQVRPVTPDRWDDLVALFGLDRGAYSGCWCMWWRQTAKEYDRDHGAPNREAMRAIVREGREPGLLAYRRGEPVGWVSLGPRGDFGRLDRSRVLGRVDDEEGVWSIVCFYIHRRHRRDGVAKALLAAAVARAAERGARCVEAYPVDLGAAAAKKASAELFTGTLAMFEDAGFREVARRGTARPIVRAPALR